MTYIPDTSSLQPGLYIVSTPIGAARDITLRALDTLAAADVLAAEDTRNARKLLEIHGVRFSGRTVLAYHDHNGAAMRPKLVRALSEGKSVAYVSDAGTPMVADPGFTLARAAIEAGHKVYSVPGASALLAALTVSGLPTDRFFFAGFPPPSAAALRVFLAGLADIEATLVFYETPKRLKKFLEACAEALGPDRPAAVCRELTKRFESITRMPLVALAEATDEMVLKGECVVVVDRPGIKGATDDDIRTALATALEDMTLKDAAKYVADMTKAPRRSVYQLGLELKSKDDGET